MDGWMACTVVSYTVATQSSSYQSTSHPWRDKTLAVCLLCECEEEGQSHETNARSTIRGAGLSLPPPQTPKRSNAVRATSV